jgi:RNA polymerase sigma factor (sigma-70 family)
MQSSRNTSLTSDRRIFVTTQWTQVLSARDDSTVALETLCATYRPALVAWLRSRGQNPDDIEDLVQGFFVHLLDPTFLQSVSREKGRFRTFLLSAFQNFLIDRWKHAHAAKRGGGEQARSLDETNENGDRVLDPRSGVDAPDAAFDRAWAQAILTRSMQLLEEECARSGHAKLCRALDPVLFAEDDAPAYSQIARNLNMTEPAVKMAAMRLRQRLKRIIRDEVLKTLADERQLEEELAYLKSLFARAS